MTDDSTVAPDPRRAHRAPAAADPAARRRLLDAPRRRPRRRGRRPAPPGASRSPARRRTRGSARARRQRRPRRRAEPDPRSALVPPALRRTSNGVLLAVAAAAVVVVRHRRHHPPGRPGRCRAGVRRRAGGADARAPSSTTPSPRATLATPMSAASEDASTDAVLAWVDDLDAGDADARLDGHGPTSQAHFGSQAEFEAAHDRPGRGLRRLVGGRARRRPRHPGRVERRRAPSPWSRWSAPWTRTAGQHRGRGLPGAARRRRRGPRALRARPARSRWWSPSRRSVDGATRSRSASGEELVVVVPSGVAAPRAPPRRRRHRGLRRAPRAPSSPSSTGSPGQRCAYLPTAGSAAGEHTLTMAFLGSDGASISAESVLFEAA